MAVQENPRIPNTFQSVPTLVKDLIGDLTTLFRQELRLAQVETSQKISSAQNGLIAIIAGLLLAFSALLVLLQAAVAGLAERMEPWLASLIVGVAVAVIALILVKSGQAKLKPAAMKPERTLASLRADKETFKEKVHESAR